MPVFFFSNSVFEPFLTHHRRNLLRSCCASCLLSILRPKLAYCWLSVGHRSGHLALYRLFVVFRIDGGTHVVSFECSFADNFHKRQMLISVPSDGFATLAVFSVHTAMIVQRSVRFSSFVIQQHHFSSQKIFFFRLLLFFSKNVLHLQQIRSVRIHFGCFLDKIFSLGIVSTCVCKVQLRPYFLLFASKCFITGFCERFFPFPSELTKVRYFDKSNVRGSSLAHVPVNSPYQLAFFPFAK